VGAVAIDDVIEIVTGAIDRILGDVEIQVFDVSRELIVQGRVDRFGSLVQAVHQYLVARIPYVVRVVSIAADHRVVAGTAVENVVAIEAEQAVVLGVADNDIVQVVAIAGPIRVKFSTLELLESA